MENGEGCDERRQLEAGFSSSEVKKQWKNPSQVQILENAYAVSRNPSAAKKEELARLTGLDYKQVQYWFGNRRYIDRHGPRRYRSGNDSDGRYVKSEAISSTSMSCSSTLIGEPMDGTDSSTWRKNSKMLQPLVPAGSVMMQADVATETTPELQRVVKHIERRLGYPLRYDGPILGLEFKPLPPGAFGSPLENGAQKREPMLACNGMVAERTNDLPVKAESSLAILEQCSSTILSNDVTLVIHDVDELDRDACPRTVQEFQFFPMQPTWLESHGRVKHGHGSFSSVDSPNRKVPTTENLSKYACAASSLPFQGRILNATNQSQEERQMVTSALNSYQKAPKLLHTNSADCQYENHPAVGVEIPTSSLDITTTCNVNVGRKDKILPSVYTKGNGKQQLDFKEVKKIVDSENGRYWGVVQVGHDDCGQGDHCQDRQDAFDIQKGLRENQCSVIVGFKEIVNQNCNEAIMDHTRNGPSHRVSNRHRYGRYVVKPRERYQSSKMVADDSRMNYFSDIGSCARPVIAEWNERENRAVYICNDNGSDLSWSIGSDSTYSDEFDDEVTANGRLYAQTKAVGPLALDVKEDDVGMDREGQEVMDVDQNVDDEDETDEEDHKDVERVIRVNNVDVDEDGRTSPLSSEKTA